VANRGPVDLRKIANSSSIHKEFKGAVALAAKHGWTGRTTGSGGIQMVSPDGTSRTYVPSSIRDGGTAAKKIIRDIEKWAEAKDRESIEETLAQIAEGVGLERDEIEAHHGPDPTISCKEHGVEFMSWEGLSEHVRTVHTEATDTNSEEPDVTVGEEIDALVHEGAAFVQSVSSAASEDAKMEDANVRPWRAILNRNLDGTVDLYESDAVLEVTSKDGRSVFRCALEGCGYESAHPRSVSSHYAHHVKAGQAEPSEKERVVVEAGVRPVWHSKKDLAREVLSREIYVALRARRRHSTETLSQFADALAEKIMANRVLAGEVDVESQVEDVPQSDSEVLLEQIRELLGGGNASREAALEEALAEEKVLRETAEAKAKRYRDTLSTLRDLADEETSGK
jgi:hypothetical protein